MPAENKKHVLIVGAGQSGLYILMPTINTRNGFNNCYLVGGGTHPGSGLPTIYESGRISANLICEQFGMPYQPVDLASAYLRDA